ncbi:MAG: glycosyltransferase family 4 protein [Chloroflexi bacterium]|nr:MAG: glycosyltransferase family 4 protein [Chloroflexota bacterium]
MSSATVRRASGSHRPGPGRRPGRRRVTNNGIGPRSSAPPGPAALGLGSSPRQTCAIILWIAHHEAGLTVRGIGFDARLIGALGIGRYISGLLPQLAQLLGDRLTVLANRQDAALVRALIGGSSHLLTVNAQPYRLAEQSVLPLTLLRADLALVHFPHYNLPLIKPGHFVVTVHDLFPFQFPEIHSGPLPRSVNQMLMRNAVRRASRVITPSRATALAVKQSFPRSADRVVSPPALRVLSRPVESLQEPADPARGVCPSATHASQQPARHRRRRSASPRGATAGGGAPRGIRCLTGSPSGERRARALSRRGPGRPPLSRRRLRPAGDRGDGVRGPGDLQRSAGPP